MNFDYFDVISSLARERQNELIQEAAERRMLRSARESHPSRGDLLGCSGTALPASRAAGSGSVAAATPPGSGDRLPISGV